MEFPLPIDVAMPLPGSLPPAELPPAELRGQRTLATVVFTDCVGFSARMSADEDGTLDLIQRDLQRMHETCTQWEGRVLKSTGDGLLMYFLSAVKAVECAVEIQTAFGVDRLTVPHRLQHRIGIHLADLFITPTDVMGNGVNIAARLQSEADPGGISISQTVYDVVKTCLHLEIVPLGVRPLKNIREAIAIYKILLGPENEQTHQFTEVVRTLERDRSLLRIKKLLHYACHNHWENDPNRLQTLNLHELIRETIAHASSPAKLEYFLRKAANTLSKPIEYTQVVDLIVLEIGKLCPHQPKPRPEQSENLTAPLCAMAPSPPTAIHNPLYAQTVQVLEHDAQATRIHKLLFYICQNRWESDISNLQQIALYDLVAQLHGRSPTRQHLEFTLNHFVQTLSKADEYQAIVTLIITAFASLYPTATATTPTATPVESPVPPLLPCPAPPIDLFNFRLELMKYTNPLQSKILLYSALHEPFQQTPQDWLHLKRHTLHSLLDTLLNTCTTYTDLEFLLYSTARRLSHPEDAIQTATDMIKCLRPFYLYGGPTALTPPVSDAALTWAVPTSLMDATAQLLAPAPEAPCPDLLPPRPPPSPSSPS
jgi:class 3 adenylate cyclase